ncbi:MAG: branched-chain amino acid ABC transporter permease [Rhizobiaceae bacterium]
MRNLIYWAAALIGLAIMPWLVPASWVVVLSKMLIAALFALAFNLLSGQAGMLSFGHAAYFATGTFATLHLMQAAEAGLSVPTPLLPIAGMIAGLICGLVCGVFATMRSGVYFSMITLAIAELFYNLAPNMHDLFGGEGGISSFRLPWAGITFGTDMQVYYLVAGWTALATALLYYYTTTPFGRLTLALRENEQRVRFLGFNAYQSRILVFSVSAMLSGLAGGLLAVTNESANYVLFEIGSSANVVLDTFIGGSGVFLGPALGAVLLTGFSYTVSDATSLVLLYEGVLFILVMIYAPQGLGGALVALKGPILSGRWPKLVAPFAVVLTAAAGATVAFVFTVELLDRFFSTEHFGRMHDRQMLLPVEFANHQWHVLSPVTWGIPLLLAIASVGLFRIGIRRSKSTWSEVTR